MSEIAAGERRPVGFPGCLTCPWRDAGAPLVCWSCLMASEPAGRSAQWPRHGCPMCGQAVPVAGACPNRWCARGDRGFSVAFPVGTHDGALRRAIARYKYRGERWWANVFAAVLAGHVLAHPTWFEDFDLVVPMPSYRGVGARRAWDPLGEIATRLRPLLGEWDVRPGLLAKRAETPAMQGRTWPEREAIARGPLRTALAVTDPPAVAGARILVVDDVLTGGASLGEVARVLRRSEAAEVAGLILARRPWLGTVADRGAGR